MTTRHFAAALVATLLLAFPAGAQSAADLLQKGIYAQETQGDLDGAVKLYREVVASRNASPQIAAQAQYQLVLCMLQKGDRPAAARELDQLTRNFPSEQDFINRARKLVPGASTLLSAPWADGEALQLNIKRDGAFTGEHLSYSAAPRPSPPPPLFGSAPSPRLFTCAGSSSPKPPAGPPRSRLRETPCGTSRRPIWSPTILLGMPPPCPSAVPR